MSFPVPRNVGALDRGARVVGGLAGMVVPAALGASWPVALPVGLLFGGIALSGVLGRCSVYHALGYSTLPEPQVHPERQHPPRS